MDLTLTLTQEIASVIFEHSSVMKRGIFGVFSKGAHESVYENIVGQLEINTCSSYGMDHL